MEKSKANDSTPPSVSASFRNLQLASNSINRKSSTEFFSSFSLHSKKWNKGKTPPPSLLNLSLGVLGSNLEEIIDDLPEIAIAFPPEIKMVLMAIARRRMLLNDVVVIALADSSWEILDISDSEVSDAGLCHVLTTCGKLKAVDISRCSRLTSIGVSKLLQVSHSLETLRWGNLRYAPSSDFTARRCLNLLKPILNDVEGDTWEELDAVQLNHGAQSLRWLVWLNIDKDSQQTLSSECPRIVVNPTLLSYRGIEVPREAVLHVLDDPVVKDINPKTWAVMGFSKSSTSCSP